MGAVDDLTKFRQTLVEMRRTCASRAHAVLSRGDRGELAAQIKMIQEWIETVDHAIEDEKKLDQYEPRLREPHLGEAKQMASTGSLPAQRLVAAPLLAPGDTTLVLLDTGEGYVGSS